MTSTLSVRDPPRLSSFLRASLYEQVAPSADETRLAQLAAMAERAPAASQRRGASTLNWTDLSPKALSIDETGAEKATTTAMFAVYRSLLARVRGWLRDDSGE